MEKTTKRGRPPRKKEPEAEVLHTTAEAICEIQKNPDTEFEQNSVFGVVVLKRSRNGGIVMTQKDSGNRAFRPLPRHQAGRLQIYPHKPPQGA